VPAAGPRRCRPCCAGARAVDRRAPACRRRYGTIDELAAAEKINSSYVSRLLRLTLLSPDIVEAILDGRQPDGVTLPGLMEPSPVEWERQRSPIRKCGTPLPCLFRR